MRLVLIGCTSILFLNAVLAAQQLPVASGVQSAPATDSGTSVPVVAPAQKPGVLAPTDDPIARGQAKAAQHAGKEQEREEARAKKQADKEKKEAEDDAKYLKLQDDEIVVASFDEQGNAVKLPPCSKKDKPCQQKRKELLKQKQVGLDIENGTLTVDGWTGKARLNYQVKNFIYVYISVPGYGTLIASPHHFPNSTELKEALDGETLTIATADDHTIQLASDKALSGKGKRSIFYSVDRTYNQPGSYPSMGYGFVSKAPYSWPGTLPPTEDQRRWLAKAPDLPKGMVATAASAPCQPVAPGATSPAKSNKEVKAPASCMENTTPAVALAGERAPDGSGAASTGIAESRTKF